MDAIERLPLEAVQEDTMISSEHRHRYLLARRLLAGQRVLDLCCGSGYGTEILAGSAATVTGVDIDVATVDTAAATVGRRCPGVSFEVADAVGYLTDEIASRFDAVVCFEGLEHLDELDLALARLKELATEGVKLLVSLPNDKLSGVQNPFHRTMFGHLEAREAFRDFPGVSMVPQFLAEGSLIVPEGASGTDVELRLGEGCEPEYANHFIFCVGFPPGEIAAVVDGQMHLNASPIFNRWSEDLKRGAAALRRENARLARGYLGKGGSAAASALDKLSRSDEALAGLRHRLAAAEQRVADLEAVLAAQPPLEPAMEALAHGADAELAPAIAAVEARPLSLGLGEDPNSWEARHRRAAEYVIPWVEKTVPLEGKTVLEYGCGNAAVSAAFAARAARVVGVDIDESWIALGRDELKRRQLGNVELEHHPVEAILDAVAARRGEVDVFLLYAVLEHLTITERLAVLALARQVVRPDGAIVVCEAPNRLIYFDHHTAQMPFFHLLPPELALRYRDRSPRQDFRATLEAAEQRGAAAASEALTRLGRGVSFHEFELVFGDLTKHVIASNYDTALFGERPIHPDEVILARYLERWRPDLAPVWSRYWLDLILSPQPVERRPPFLRPWAADTDASRGVGWTNWENLHLKDPDATLWITLPQPSSRLLVGSVTQDGRWLVLHARAEGRPEVLASSHTAAAGHTAFSEFVFAEPVARVALQASDDCHVVFVGYED